MHPDLKNGVIFTEPNSPHAMLIEMKKDATPDDVRAALEKIQAAKAAERQRKRLASFGAWKTVADGVNYQRVSRDEWH